MRSVIDGAAALPVRLLVTLGDTEQRPGNQVMVPMDYTIDGSRLICRPMKGTAARGRYPKDGEITGRIEVEGQTDTPDFQIAVSGHRVPLHTDFHAIVDGTDGDTYLEPVKARVLHSSFTARGKIVRMKNLKNGSRPRRTLK